MRKNRENQMPLTPLWPDHRLGDELQMISRILDENPEILDLVLQDLSDKADPCNGSPGLSAEQVVRCAVIKNWQALLHGSGPISRKPGLALLAAAQRRQTAGAPPQEPQHQPRRERDDPGVDPDAGRSEQTADGGGAHREWTKYGRAHVCSRPGNRMQPLQGARQRDAAGPGEDESEDHRGQGEQHRDETGRETRVEAEPDHRQNDHANRQPQRELQRSYHAD